MRANPRGALAISVLGGKIYAIGSVGSNTAQWQRSYDPAQDRWGKPAMQTPQDHQPWCPERQTLRHRRTINSRHDKSITANEEYDSATDRWGRDPLPTVRSGIVAASLNDKVFVFRQR
jgi:hypothetical protein